MAASELGTWALEQKKVGTLELAMGRGVRPQGPGLWMGRKGRMDVTLCGWEY